MIPNNQNTPQSRNSRIPKFSSYQEEADWWDTHDITEYLDELDPVNVRVAKDLKSIYVGGNQATNARLPLKNMNIRLPVHVVVELRRRAARKGIRASTLARMMLIESLHQPHTDLYSNQNG